MIICDIVGMNVALMLWIIMLILLFCYRLSAKHWQFYSNFNNVTEFPRNTSELKQIYWNKILLYKITPNNNPPLH